MGRCRVVRPETVRLNISDGDWIEVKKKLTYGEAAKARAAVVKEVRSDGRMTPDFELVEIAQLMAYLVDWSLVDLNGTKLRIDSEAKLLAGIHAQDQDTIRELIDAVSAHIDAMTVEADAEKNAKAGGSASLATSASASA